MIAVDRELPHCQRKKFLAGYGCQSRQTTRWHPSQKETPGDMGLKPTWRSLTLNGEENPEIKPTTVCLPVSERKDTNGPRWPRTGPAVPLSKRLFVYNISKLDKHSLFNS